MALCVWAELQAYGHILAESMPICRGLQNLVSAPPTIHGFLSPEAACPGLAQEVLERLRISWRFLLAKGA